MQVTREVTSETRGPAHRNSVDLTGGGDRLDESTRRVIDERDEPGRLESPREPFLVVVDSLGIPVEAGHDDGPPSVRERQHYRSHAGMRHHDPRFLDLLDEIIVWEEVDTLSPGGANGGRPVLDEDRLVALEGVDRLEKPVEARVAAADGYEDHGNASSEKTLPT